MALEFDQRLDQVNNRLKIARIGVRIYRKDQRLLLRATLPPKPGSKHLSAYQQWIALGTYANIEGLKQAEALAKTIGGQLARQVFDWQPYLKPQDLPLHHQPLSVQIQCFMEHFMAQRGGQSAVTLKSVYVPYFNKLQTTADADPQGSLRAWIEKTLLQIPAHSRGRQLACTAFRQLSLFLELDPEFIQPYRGGYNLHAMPRRDLPSDALILECFQRIPNPQWRMVYGLMAAFGLRPHECFFCELEPFQAGAPTLWVRAETKTGAREVWPFHPEWSELLGLRTGSLPQIRCDTSRKNIGSKVNTQFRRYQIPFNPYLLRHAWAVRTIHYGLDSSIVSPMMGHGVAIHTRVYHHWLTRRDQEAAVQRALRKT